MWQFVAQQEQRKGISKFSCLVHSYLVYILDFRVNWLRKTRHEHRNHDHRNAFSVWNAHYFAGTYQMPILMPYSNKMTERVSCYKTLKHSHLNYIKTESSAQQRDSGEQPTHQASGLTPIRRNQPRKMEGIYENERSRKIGITNFGFHEYRVSPVNPVVLLSIKSSMYNSGSLLSAVQYSPFSSVRICFRANPIRVPAVRPASLRFVPVAKPY